MKKILISISLLMLLSLLLATLAIPATASPQPQAVYLTPTPREDGRIIYIVKKDETCISIALLNGITVDQLRELNNISGEACLIYEGQELILATAAPTAVATAGPSPTPTEILPSPTPFRGYAEVCVVLYNDINGNGMAEEAEARLAGGVVDITNRTNTVSLAGETKVTETGLDFAELMEVGLCFAEVPEGQYTITIAIPQGYNATTRTSLTLTINAGDQSVLNFGAQKQTSIPVGPEIPAEDGGGGQTPLLGILGGIMLLLGILLAVYWRLLKK